MKDAPVYVYLPDDEPETGMFNGQEFPLVPNATTEIVSPWKEFTARDIALHIVEKLGRWGVCLVNGPAKDSKASNREDQATVDAAELTYLRSTKEWAEGFISSYTAANKIRQESGLDAHPEDDATKRARGWLKAYRPKLIAAGFISKG